MPHPEHTYRGKGQCLAMLRPKQEVLGREGQPTWEDHPAWPCCGDIHSQVAKARPSAHTLSMVALLVEAKSQGPERSAPWRRRSRE